MREPSLHITQSSLHKVIKKIAKELELDFDIPTKQLVKRIMQEGKIYSLNSRNLLVDTKKVQKKVDQLGTANMDNASCFSKYLQLIRKRHYHRGINIIKEGNKEWATLKEVTKLALSFAADFSLPREKAFEQYIEIGLGKMGKFSLSRFNSIHQSICDHYYALLQMAEIRDPEMVEKAYDIYRERIIERIGSCLDYKSMPEKYVWFNEVVKKCKAQRVSLFHYIQSQFDGLDWAGGIPEPHSLVGIKADERLQKYLYKNKINLGEEETKPKLKWDKIIHNGKNPSKQ